MENAAKLSTFILQVWKLRFRRAMLCTKLASSPRHNYWQDWLQNWCLLLIHICPSHDTVYFGSYSLERFASNFWGTTLVRRAPLREIWALDAILFLECGTWILEKCQCLDFQGLKSKFDRQHSFKRNKCLSFLMKPSCCCSFLEQIVPCQNGSFEKYNNNAVLK